jgi:predicted Rdx family selenoprotein
LDAAIREAFPDAQVELIRGSGGNFIVTADGVQLWHKRQMGDTFPDPGEIVARLRG